jgi:hypothetical protein
VPVVVKRRKHAQEEEETYEHEVSGSEEEYNPEEEEILEEEEEEVEYESDSVSDIEEELPTTSKTLKEHAADSKKKIPLKRKLTPDKPEKKRQVVAKKVRTATPQGGDKRVIRKVVKKVDAKPDGKKQATTGGGATLPVIEYNDKNVDYNLYNEAPENIKNVKIKISSNLVMMCRMIEATGTTAQSLNYDYAALSFVRQSKNGRAYEYNVQLSSAPAIMKGISLIMKQNPKFFDKNFQAATQPQENE